MRFAGQRQFDDEGGFPMAAMVDIIFLLLIFFVSTSVFYRLEADMDIMIPTAEKAEVSERKAGEIIVNVKKNGTIVVNQMDMKVAELTRLLSRVAQLYEGQAVIIRGDRESQHQDIMRVLDACAKANIWNVSFAALTEGRDTAQPGG